MRQIQDSMRDTREYEHITPVVHQHHHQLSIHKWVGFKVLCLTYMALHNKAPLYLTHLLTQTNVHRQVTCNDYYLLGVPLASLKCAKDRTHNALLVNMKTARSLAMLKIG